MEEKPKTVKQLINEWFDGERNYTEGLNLLERASPNLRSLIKHLRRGENTEKMKHLTYALYKISDYSDPKICDGKIAELKKIAKPKKEKAKGKNESKKDIKKIVVPDNKITSKSDLPLGDKKEAESDIELSFKDGSPEAILLAKIIERQKAVYNERALAHKQMTDLEDDNSEETVCKRMELLAKIEHCAKIVDYLHAQKLSWKESGITPDEIILEWIPITEASAEEKKDLIVEDIAEVDLQLELQKVRSRLSKYPAKIEKYTGDKLAEIKAKQAEDLKLKEELTLKLNDLRNK